MTRDEFKRAFTEAVSMEFADIPTKESEIDVTFSQEFLRKMDNLIMMQKDGIGVFFNTMRKHVAMIAIIVLGVMITACGVTQVMKYLHYDIYTEMKNEFLENGGALDMNAEFHELTYVPEGFTKSSVDSSAANKIVEYENKSWDKICFLQDKTGESYYILTEESVTSENVTIDGNTVVLFKNNKLIGAMWIEDGIYMEILYFDGTDMEELKAIVEGVR